MSREIPVGALVELRGSNEDWRVVSYWDNEMPKFCRQYMIMNTNIGATKRVFKHDIYEKDTSTYQDIHAFFREQLSQEIKEEFLNSSMSDTHEEHSFTLDDLIQPHDTEMNERPAVRNPQSPAKSPAQSPH